MKAQGGLSAIARGLKRRWASLGLAAVSLVVLNGVSGVAAAATPSAGWDISFPNCKSVVPAASANGPSVVGVNGGRPFTVNPCFTSEYRWASRGGQTPSLYMNLDSPRGAAAARGQNGPRGQCAASDRQCTAFNYGYNGAQMADSYAQSQHATESEWWLDVETDNYWSSDRAANAQVIAGAISYFQQHNLPVGIYSIKPMWKKIAGSYAPGVPLWVAQTSRSVPVMNYCGPAYAFGGGTTVMVQHWANGLDVDYLCPAAGGAAPAPANPASLPATGTLVGNTAGNAVDLTIPYGGNDQHVTVTVDFSPNGPDVSNALFLTVLQDGKPVSTARAADIANHGHLTLTFSNRSADPVTIRLANFNDPNTTQPVSYTIRVSP